MIPTGRRARPGATGGKPAELYGTAIGTWEWAALIPGTEVPQGNPPSGVASGYVFFDIVALAVAPWLIRWGARIRPGSRPLPDAA